MFRARMLVFPVVLVALVAAMATGAAAQGDRRSLFVVGDSIALAAADEIVASMPAYWDTNVDAEENRQTNEGLDVILANRSAIDDVLVVGLGANDGATASVFAPRVDAILAEVADVPQVFWIEVAEVRDYYPLTNQIIREAAAGYDNVTVIAWSELALSNPSFTAADGLHLTQSGAQAFADNVMHAVLAPDVQAFLLAEAAKSLSFEEPDPSRSITKIFQQWLASAFSS